MQLLFCCQNLVGWFARRRRNGHKSCELFNYVTIIKDNTIRIKRQGKRYTTKSNGLGRQRSSSIRGAIPLYIKQAPAVTLSHSLVHWLATIRSPELNFRHGGGGFNFAPRSRPELWVTSRLPHPKYAPWSPIPLVFVDQHN